MNEPIYEAIRGLLLLPFRPLLWLSSSLDRIEETTPEETPADRAARREHVRDSLQRLQSSLTEIGGMHFLEDVFSLVDRTFGGPEGFVRFVRAWTDLVDTLTIEAEAEFGAAREAGDAKKRAVKGAFLYLLQKSKFDLPHVPAVLEPLVLDVVLDPVIEALVSISNRHQRWGPDRVERGAAFRFRLAVNRTGGKLGGFAGTLTRWLWALVLGQSSISPRLRAAVDRFLEADPEPQRTAVALLQWGIQRSHELSILAQIFADAVVEARALSLSSPEERKAYARELVLALMEDAVDLPDPDSLGGRLLDWTVDIGLDLATMLFEKAEGRANTTGLAQVA